MTQGIMVVSVLLLLLLLVLIWRTKSNTNHLDEPLAPVKGDELAVFPFEPMPLMTNSEVMFFHRLCQAIPECLVFSQVQLSRIIAPLDDDETDQNFWFNRICRMSIDYVLVAEDCQTVLLAIELDDWTHASRRRQQQDEKKDKALNSAGIPVLRIDSERLPDVEALRAEILTLISD